MEARKRVLGLEHPDTLTSMANLASAFWYQGRWKKAEELEVQVMETRKRILGLEHPDTLSSMANLAFTLWSLNLKNEAIQLKSKVVQYRQEKIGSDQSNQLYIGMRIMWDAKPVVTPMDINKLELPEEGYTCSASEKQWYSRAIRSLMYAMLGTRVVTAFSVSVLSWYLANPGPAHIKAAKRVMRYLRGTSQMELAFRGTLKPLIG